jgi:photosystem II stability/assembly factor-like uncharacterized protein
MLGAQADQGQTMEVKRARWVVTLLLLTASTAPVQSVHAQDKPAPQGWKALATLPGAYVQDLSFVTGDVGYAASGNGQIFKTTDGGATWSAVLDLGSYPHWYGVHALNANDIVVSGFYNNGEQDAVIRWSHDGGASWSDDLLVSRTDWANRIHFWDSSTGVVTSGTGKPNLEFRTISGGLQLSDWNASTIDPDGGWFGGQFSALPNGHVRISGITYCESLDFAATWSCRPSIDSVFDGATFFLDDKRGWVGSGVISIPRKGWVHRTTDGGKTWSGRTLEGPWAIREIVFVNAKDGWAAGGSGDYGGIYVSHDGGETWQVELDAGVGLTACSTADYHIFCAGYDNSSTSHFYARDYDHIRRDNFDADAIQ